jgi:hypothetical protein
MSRRPAYSRCQNYGGRRAAAADVIVGVQGAAPQRGHFQRLEKIAADPDALGIARLAAAGQVKSSLSRPSKHAGKNLLVSADLFPLCIGDVRVATMDAAGIPGAVDDSHAGKLLWIVHRESAQAQRIDELEDGGVCTGAKRQRKHGNSREAGIETQHPQTVASVLPQRTEPAAQFHAI